MNQKTIVSIITFSLSISASYFDQANVAMIAVPVTDALSKPAQTDPAMAYASLPYSPDSSIDTCPRVHQLLFNEVGIVKEEQNGQVLIEFPHFFCEKRDTKERFAAFWLMASHIRVLQSQERALVPEPIQLQILEPIVSLIVPWTDKTTGNTYSAGTRFKSIPEKNTPSHFAIVMLDPKTGLPHEALIDGLCAWFEHPREAKEAKKVFVSLLKVWANQSPQSIPYVLGGCSCISTMPEYFYRKELSQNATAWERPSAPIPHTGLDCSSLVLRAAQLARVKSNNALYACKNTTTIVQNLTPLGPSDGLEEGDLLLIPGHVMIVSDLVRNLLIQAVSYGSGYGCVHEIPLSCEFKGITTYDQLRSVPHVTLLAKDGSEFKADQPLHCFRMGDA